MSKPATLLYPRLIRYRSPTILRLITLVQAEYSSAEAINTSEQLHRRLTLKPFLLANERAVEAAEARFTNWVPPADNKDTIGRILCFLYSFSARFASLE